LSTADGTLELTSMSPISGTDALGPFTGMSYRWAAKSGGSPRREQHSTVTHHQQAVDNDYSAAPVVMETAFLMSSDGTTLRFNASFPSGVDGASSGGTPTSSTWGDPGTSFPSFSVGDAKGKLGHGLGYLSYGEIGRPRGGVFPTGFKSGSNEEDGVPLALMDRESNTAAMLSPSDGFFDTVFGFTPSLRDGGAAGTGSGTSSTSGGVLRCGVIGTATNIPAGWSYQVRQLNPWVPGCESYTYWC
jgi:hypothetical protein